MKIIAIQKASEHLELAKAAVPCLNLADGPKAYERAWSEFLTQSSRFYSKLEQGAKGCNKSTPWFGLKKHERKTDPLMSYIHHARDGDEHGLDYVVVETGSELRAYMAKGATEYSVTMQVMMDSFGKMHVRHPKTSTPEAVRLELIEPRMELVTVKDSRFGDSFDPPLMHRSRPIVDRSPEAIASLALRYMDEMLKEASQLPEHV